jgi:hypothetical protein
MKNMLFARAALAAALVEVSVIAASAQTSEGIGIRAQGMGGAFTAVADDASATWWNPAGLAGGAYFNTIVESGQQQKPIDDRSLPASETVGRGFSVAYPALGVSYYRLQVSAIQPATTTADGGPGRQDGGSLDIRLQSLVLNQFGVTVGQSLGNHLIVASTAKLVHGSLATQVRPAAAASLDAAADLDGDGETDAGLDIGAMAKFGTLRLGLMVRNVTEPTFGEGPLEVKLERYFRAGVAFSSDSGLSTVAADFDLTTTLLPTGKERRAAIGLEEWAKGKRFGFRGGASVNTLDADQIVVSGGVSAAVRSGTYIDAAGTYGSDESQRGWGFGLRVTF